MKDYEYLIHLIYCFLNDETPEEKPEEVSFENVFLLGKMHEVANIAFLSVEKLNNKPDEALYNEWKVFYYFSIERDSRQSLERQRVLSFLHEKGIRTLEAQGTLTKKLYPETYLRMMTDIDLIIDEENIEKTMTALEELEYTVKELQHGEFYADNKEGFELDFHIDFFSEYMFNRQERYSKAVSSPFSHAVQDSEDELTYILDDNYFYLYSVIHTIKHYETAGCGIRRILDLYYLKKAFENKIDKEFFDNVIDENGFRNTFEFLYAVEGEWFEGKESELDLSEVKRDIITSGNHGNEEIFTRNNVRKDIDGGVSFARIKRVFSFLFPEKEYIYIEFPECRERGYSLAKCRLYRIIQKVKRLRFKHAITHIKQIVKSK